MFEPVHGPAPDIAGKGIANLLGQIWTGKLMLDFLGYPELGAKVMDAMEETLAQGIKTGDLSGEATLHQLTDDILHQLQYRLFYVVFLFKAFILKNG